MVSKNIFKNKKAEISILEAFFAISVIIVIVGILIEQNSSQDKDLPERVYYAEMGILRTIQIDESYRADVLATITPAYWNETSFPSEIREKIEEKKPSYLDCRAKICEIKQSCPLEEDVDDSVYMQSAFISANATLYSPKELRLFCWEK